MALSTLSIDLVANLAKLEQGLDKAARLAEKHADQQRAAWNRLGATVTSVAGMVSGVFAGTSVVAFVQNQAQALDALNDAADATGASIENLSALEAVGKSVGTQFDTVTSILVKFNSVLSDAKPGSSQADALKAIGLSAAELQRLDPAEALRRTAVALSGYADDGNKARLVQDLFGKSVREAAPFLKDLAEVGQLNATTTSEQAAEAEKFNKNLVQLQNTISTAARKLSNELIPAINRYFDSLKTNGGLGNVILNNAGFDVLSRQRKSVEQLQLQLDAEGGKAAQLKQALEKAETAGLPPDRAIKQAYDASRERIRALQVQAEDATAALKALANRLNPQGPPQAAYSNEGRLPSVAAPRPRLPGGDKATPDRPELMGPDLPDAYKRAQSLIEQTDDFKRQQLAETLQVLLTRREQLGSSEALDAAIAKARDEMDKLSPAARKAAEEQQRLQQLLDGMQSAQLEKARADMVRLAEAFEAGAITAEQFNDAATQRLGNLAPAIEKTTERIDEFTQQAARNIQDALGDTVLRALDGKFDNILDLWANMLKRMAAEAAGAQLAKYLLGDFGKTGEVGGLVGKGLEALAEWVGGFWAKGGAFDASGPIKPFASGDVFDRATLFGYGGGRLGVLGEAGPEAIMPLRRGADGKLGVASAGGGGTRVTVPITIQAGVTRAEVAQLIPVIQEQAKAAVFQAMRRPGAAYRN